MAVLSTLRVLERAVIRKQRKLPTPGDVLVSEGNEVKPDTVIAKAEFVKGNPHIVDLRAELRQPISPDLVDRVLLKKTGDIVKAKEVIARYQKGFWSEVIEVTSPCDGVIEYTSRTQGRIVIREDPRSAKPVSIVAAASRLSVRPRFLRLFTTVREGDYVYEGKIIAELDGKDFVYAPISGIVEKICTLTGTITIVKPIKHTRVLAHIRGRVSKEIPHYGAVVETIGAYIQGVFGIGRERSGELVIMSEAPDRPLDEGRLNEDVKGKILACGSFASLESIQQAREQGALGLITGGMNQLDLVRVAGRELGTGLTGQEDTDFTIVITEGFGQLAMSRETWNILEKYSGNTVSMDGTTQIRAGVIRPEVIIDTCQEMQPCLEQSDPGLPVISDEITLAPSVTYTSLTLGDRVRCTRPPYFGLWGRVEELPEQPGEIECEAVVEVAKVRLDDGKLVTVPQTNLEVFNR
ncbi:MAG: hypothetical protein ACOX34_05305 [Bacillota bacterium]|jgi:hypothetical protein|nr:hypothetical protein [Candidatus Fermentithermobacillaceae bacterium]